MDKFLRRNSFSSDEKSAPLTTNEIRNKTKSLESLQIEPKKTSKSLFQAIKPPDKEANKSTEKKKPMECANAKVIVKQSAEKLDKKRPQFNYESVIEITIPSAPTQHLPQRDIPEKLEEPIKPIIQTPIKPKIPPHNNKNVSPTESYVSNKQNPLEWDSFLPVSATVAINSYDL